MCEPNGIINEPFIVLGSASYDSCLRISTVGLLTLLRARLYQTTMTVMNILSVVRRVGLRIL